MKRTVVLMGLLALLVALPVGITSAKADDVYCGDLAAPDCALLRASNETMETVETVVYDASFGFDVMMEDAPVVSAAFSASGAVDPGQAQIDAVTNEVLDMRIRDVLALVEDPEALADTLLGYAERVLTAPQMSADLTMTFIAEDETSGPFNLRLRVVDGVVYGNSELLAAGGMSPDQWISLDTVQVAHMVAEALQNPDLMSGFMGGMSGGADMGGMSSGGEMGAGSGDFMAQFNGFGEQIAAIQNNPAWEVMDSDAFRDRILDIQRIEDSEIDGVPVAVFETTMDFGALAETEEFRSVMNDIFAFYTFIPEDNREAFVDATLDMMSDMTWVMTEAVGLEDTYLYGMSFAGEQTIDPVVFVEAMGEDVGDADIPLQTTTYEFQLTLTDHNEPVVVEAPDEADVLPLFQLLGMGSAPAEPMAMPEATEAASS